MDKAKNSTYNVYVRQKFSAIFVGKIKELSGADLRSLALFRVGLGALTLADLIMRARNLVAHYSDNGVITRSEAFARNYDYSFSFHYISGAWQFQALLFLIAAVFAVFLLVGYRTRLSTIISWLFLISIQERNPSVLQGSDVLHRMMLFWGMFLPLGARYSLDSLKKTSVKTVGFISSFGIFAYLLQISFVYIFNALHKTGDMWTTQGSAMYYALSLDQFHTPFTQLLYSQPALMRGLTHYVWYLELLAPLLLFFPFFTRYIRFFAAVLLMGMHLGIFMNMTIGLFPLLDIVSLTPFLTPWFWEKVMAFLNGFKRFSVNIYYDGECGFCKKSVQIIKTFFLLPKTGINSALKYPEVQSLMLKNNSWVIEDGMGRKHFKWDGAVALTSASPLLFWLTPLMKIPPITYLGNIGYEFVAAHRKTACPINHKEEYAFPEVKQKTNFLRQLVSSILPVFFIIYIFLWNLNSLPDSKLSLNPDYQGLAYVLNIDQTWNMFSPYPLTEDGWYTITGTTQNDKKFNLLNEKEPVTLDTPKNRNPYTNNHWRKFLMEMYLSGHEKDRELYADFLCRNWNYIEKRKPKLKLVEVYFTPEFTLDHYQNNVEDKQLLALQECR